MSLGEGVTNARVDVFRFEQRFASCAAAPGFDFTLEFREFLCRFEVGLDEGGDAREFLVGEAGEPLYEVLLGHV